MKDRCVCTIICSNYFAHGRTLAKSLAKATEGLDVYVLILDATDAAESQGEPFTVVLPQQLGISEFRQLSFIYNALELSTNVKPRFLQYLLEKGYRKVIYFDPDIYIYRDISFIFQLLDHKRILLTPHSTSPIDDTLRPSDQDLLLNGVYNLGFIGISSGQPTTKFLEWWCKRCFQLGFREQRSGLMVDQKWVNLAPCYFEGTALLKHPGCNMAYWNLHERRLIRRRGSWIVNGKYPLVFYHFSGIRYNESIQISKYQNRYCLQQRDDVRLIFDEYRQALERNGIASSIVRPYAYDYFDNGAQISELARKMYYNYRHRLPDEDPFSSRGRYYRWVKQNGLLGHSKTSDHFTSLNYDPNDPRLRFIHACLKSMVRIVGVDMYTMLMKYLGHISLLRHQNAIFPFQ